MIQLKPGETIDSYIERRRTELMGGAEASPFANVESGSSSQPTSTVEAFKPPEGDNYIDRFVNNLQRYGSMTEEEKQAERDYFKQYGADATRLNEILGGPATKGANIIKGVGGVIRKGVLSRRTGEAVAKKTGIQAARETPQGLTKSAIDDVAENADDMVEVIKGRIKTPQDAEALGSKVFSKASLATKTPDDFGRILMEVPEELIDDFYRGMGTKLVQAVRDMPRLTKDAQRNMLSPSGRNLLKHTLQGMDDAEFDKLMVMLERGLWTEVRNKILKWGVGLPLLGYIGLRQILPK